MLQIPGWRYGARETIYLTACNSLWFIYYFLFYFAWHSTEHFAIGKGKSLHDSYVRVSESLHLRKWGQLENTSGENKFHLIPLSW